MEADAVVAGGDELILTERLQFVVGTSDGTNCSHTRVSVASTTVNLGLGHLFDRLRLHG
jgi:hypothetical protein